jgi:hypothetical protein
VARGFNYSLVTKEESIGYKRADEGQVALPGVRVRFRPNSTTGLARSEVSKAAGDCGSGKGERITARTTKAAWRVKPTSYQV